MIIVVTSNNGNTHFAESITQTKGNTPKEYPGFVRKLCDGQWVSEKKQSENKATCPTCMKILRKKDSSVKGTI